MLERRCIKIIWTLLHSPLFKVHKCINDYVTDCIVIPCIGDFIREVCTDCGEFTIKTSTEMCELLSYMCTCII